jgi:hypothetical protein
MIKRRIGFSNLKAELKVEVLKAGKLTSEVSRNKRGESRSRPEEVTNRKSGIHTNARRAASGRTS